MKTETIVLCARCQGRFTHPSGGGATKAACPFCGHAHVVNIKRSGMTGTQRTADSTGDATAATGITVT